MHLHTIGSDGRPDVLFTHGWGRSHHDFIPVAESLAAIARSTLVDLPGFGETPRPEGPWTTADYAGHVHSAMLAAGRVPYLWVGHSFGGRLGLRAAVAFPGALTGMVLVAAAGIPRARTPWQRLRGRWRSAAFGFHKGRAGSEAEIIELERRFGSADYVASRASGLRDIFLATVAEDQSRNLPRIATPTRLIYGAQDTETPPEIGRRMAAAIPGAECVVLDGLDHIGVLARGRHQIARAVRDLLREGGPA